jgi:RNA polymerase sigma factor (TIGR02999 family)
VSSISFQYPGHAESGDRMTIDSLFSTFYAELRRLAKIRLARLQIAKDLSETELLHDVYLQMAEQTARPFLNHQHFINYVSRVMHSLIVDHVRSRNACKRGRDFEIIHLTSDITYPDVHPKEIAMMRHTLDQLAKVQPELAELIDLKFFYGFSLSEIASMQSVSERTVQRKWDKARHFIRTTVHAEHFV